MSKIDQIHIRAVMLYMSKVEDVEDIKTSHNRCLLKYVEDVKDRSNTHKGCNAMDVEDVEDGKRKYTHILAHNFLNT